MQLLLIFEKNNKNLNKSQECINNKLRIQAQKKIPESNNLSKQKKKLVATRYQKHPRKTLYIRL